MAPINIHGYTENLDGGLTEWDSDGGAVSFSRAINLLKSFEEVSLPRVGRATPVHGHRTSDHPAMLRFFADNSITT